MQEQVLRDFFEGRCSAVELSRDLDGSLVPASPQITKYPVVDMDSDLEVKPEYLLRVCEAVIAGAIEPWKLQAIGFCLVASDRFHWDGDTDLGSLVAETAHDWSSPETNYPLTLENVAMFRRRLANGIQAYGSGRSA